MKKNDLVKKIKGNSWANDFVRRNPYYYGEMTRLIDDLYNSDLEKRKSWAQKKLRESIKIALKTSYGKNASRTQNFSDWPILDKETVKKSPDTFCTSLKYLSIPS